MEYAKTCTTVQKSLGPGHWNRSTINNCKNSVDNLEKQIATVKENWKTSFVYAPISGTADVVNIKAGEIFNGASPTGPQIQLVNTNSMKVVTEVPENYQERVKKGSQLKISIPDAGIQNVDAVISVTGASIASTTRAFLRKQKFNHIRVCD